jgi:hypothetical protein
VDISVAGVASLHPPKYDRWTPIALANKLQHAEAICGNPGFVGRREELALEIVIGILHFAESQAGKFAVARWLTARL